MDNQETNVMAEALEAKPSAIRIKSIDAIRDDDGKITGIPMFGKMLTFFRITAVAGDDNHDLNYIPGEGNVLANNYVMGFVEDGINECVMSVIPNAETLCKECGFKEEDVDVLNRWFHDIDGRSAGIPVTVIDANAVAEVDIACPGAIMSTLIFGNLFEYYRDLEDAEIVTLWNTEDHNPCSFDEFKRLQHERNRTTYRRLKTTYPDMEENCNRHMYIRSVLAKLAGIIQKRYNQIHFDDVVTEIAKKISEVEYFDDNGNIVPLTISGVENMFDRIKREVRIGKCTSSKSDFEKLCNRTC